MINELVTHDEIKFIGICVQSTSFQNELNQETAKIGPTAARYFTTNVANTIPNRVNPGVTLAIYSDYESDEYGNYSYFIGEAVSSVDNVPEGLTAKIIPTGKFQKFTTDSGKMPGVVIEAWQHIWDLSEDDLEGERKYLSDFEVYDARAADPNNTVVDVFVGIE